MGYYNDDNPFVMGLLESLYLVLKYHVKKILIYQVNKIYMTPEIFEESKAFRKNSQNIGTFW